MPQRSPSRPGSWPDLAVAEWLPTLETLHRWTQIVGKVRMAMAPPLNHWWHVTLYVAPRGLTTSLVPAPGGGFEAAFDFAAHELRIETVDGRSAQVPLEPRSVADFHTETMARLAELDIHPRFAPAPNEVEDATPFADDHHHAAYDPAAVERFHRVLVDAHRVLSRYRSRFAGKSSPVHFFWGSFDLAVTRFSGRDAPRHPGGAPNCPDWVMHEAYSQEVASTGWWPGGGERGLFYAYAYPEPDGYRDRPVAPDGARYDPELREFVLPYELVARAADPDAVLERFCESTYAAAADLAGWDRAGLEMPADAAPPWTCGTG
jgi:hypothetical protein